MGCSHLCPRPSSRHCAADIGCISLPSTSAERKNTRGKVSIKLRVSRPRWLNLNAVSNPINTSANESLTGHSFGAKRELVCNFRSRRHLWHLERLDKETGQSRLLKDSVRFESCTNKHYRLSKLEVINIWSPWSQYPRFVFIKFSIWVSFLSFYVLVVHVSLRSYVVSFSFLLLNGVLVSKVMGRGILVFVLGILSKLARSASIHMFQQQHRYTSLHQISNLWRSVTIVMTFILMF